MGKRSDFKRNPRDKYNTPLKAVAPLVGFLPHGSKFIEPCANNGLLTARLLAIRPDLECIGESDIEPFHHGIAKLDAACDYWEPENLGVAYYADYFITNPPWLRAWLHPILESLPKINPTWILLDADWKETKQAKKYLPICRAYIPIGRVKWLEGSANTGKDNCGWYLFDATKEVGPGPIIHPVPDFQIPDVSDIDINAPKDFNEITVISDNNNPNVRCDRDQIDLEDYILSL